MPPPSTKLNLPGRLAQTFVDSPLVILMIVGLLLYGALGLVYTPREENPQIIVPAAEVRVDWPGATPAEVEQALLRPLETLLGAIDGVKHTYGTASAGLATIQVEFEVGEDKDDALVRVYDHVLRNRQLLPATAGEPQIRSIDVDDVPVFTLTLASDHYSDYELHRMAERVLERLRNLPNVGVNYIVGGRQRELRIEVDPERLHAFGLSANQIGEAVREANRSGPLGVQVVEGENQAIRYAGALRNAEQLGALVVGAHGSRTVHLYDVAKLVDGPPAEPDHYSRFAFGIADPRYADTQDTDMAAVTLAIAKRPGVNSVPFTESLRERLDLIRGDVLPPDVLTVVTRDDGRKADQTVSNLVEHIFIAVASVTVVLLLFLGWRAALVVVLVIPLVIFTVIGSDLLAGPTLNRITLYSLILALGMLVDDAIVVIENAHRHFHRLPADASRKQRASAVVQATHEIGNPTTLATLTIVLVFLSLILVSGMLGQYFRPMTFNLPVAMLASLFIAYTITPWMIRRWLLCGGNHQEGQDTRDTLQRLYHKLFNPLLDNPRKRHLFYLCIGVLLVLSLLQPAWQFIRPQGVSGGVSWGGVPLAFLPKADKNTFLITLHMPEATPLETTDRVVRDLESILKQQPEIANYQAYVGVPSVIDFNGQLRGSAAQVGPQYASIRVNLTNKHERDISSIKIVQQLRPALQNIVHHTPEAVVQLVEDPPGPPVRATVLAELYGADHGKLEQLAKSVEQQFKSTYDMAEAFTSVPTDVFEHRLSVDREKATLSGVDAAQVQTVLKQMLQGEILDYVRLSEERQPLPIRLKVPRARRVEPDQLARITIHNHNGQAIPLSELVRTEPAIHAHPILHKDTERVEYVGGELTDSAPVYAVLDLDKRIDGKTLNGGPILHTSNLGFNAVRPDTLNGYQLLWEGELRLTLDAFRDMGGALALALIAIYLLLVGYYQSFRVPLLAMVSIPLAMIGVFPAHWLLGVTFSAASMIGVIALAGVVVRNSLLIIDFARTCRAHGHSIEEAVREAGALRLRPILLTTLAIVVGTAIMLPDAVLGGLAISLIFGSVSSALFTVFVIPLLYRKLHAASVPPVEDDI